MVQSEDLQEEWERVARVQSSPELQGEIRVRKEMGK